MLPLVLFVLIPFVNAIPREEPSLTSQTPLTAETGPAAVGEIFAPAKYCDAETRKGIRYPKTRACTEARIACPDPENIVGTIIRYCNCQTAKWEPADTTNCSHKWIAEIRSALERGEPAEEISTRIAADLESTLSRQLYGGDITGSVSLNNDVLQLARSQYTALNDRYERQSKATNFTESFGSSGNHLLSPKALPVWEELTAPIRIDHASTLMAALEQSAILLADNSIDQKKRLQYSNWVISTVLKENDVERSFGSSGNHLLSPKALPVWEELTAPIRIDHASTLMAALEQSAILLADNSIDQKKRLQYSNWAMEIDIRQPEAYAAPNDDSMGGARSGSRPEFSPSMEDDHFQTFAAAASPVTTAAPPPSVQFSGFSQSPIITLPSLSVLKSSANAASPQKAVGSSAFFHPGVEPSSQQSLDRSRLRLGYYVFTTFGQLLAENGKTIVNSHVIGASVDDATRSLK
ncbi:hypothetical protein NECAME_15569 [Necator americanus]|uniref:G-protein coupled receptors family 2 profile 1 domain-containing protein n=1 Tax=Necator americanus TaxID=51031 RepID=W2SH23_NECAM|nr:hypothetical protein NECAME_15569 [Necator americanus]ETN68895.1 hypothetical protein NECAME_15569 [Necator americanus]